MAYYRSSRRLSPAAKVRRVACPETYGPRQLKGCGAPAGEPCRNPDGTPRTSNHQARVKAHKAAFPPVESIHAAGGAARDHYGREHAVGHGPAAHGSICPRCDEQMLTTDAMVKTPRGWIHRACAPGADDQ